MSIEVFSGKIFLLITGASRGIGKQVAITFGSLLQEGSHMLLLARSLDNLQKVAKEIPSNVTVDVISMDLSIATKDDLKETILNSLKEITPETFDRVILVHNAATHGDLTKYVNELADLDSWRKYYDMNLFIPAILNTVIMTTFENKNIKKLIINISSLFAIKPSGGCVQYCSAKAAREMYFKVFAIENPDVDVLNYAPGPVDTDMLRSTASIVVDPNTREEFKQMLLKKIALTPEQTTTRLVEILQKHKYRSADHVDYFDYL